MADSVLFYKNIVPLNRDAHRNLTLDTQAARFGFTRASNVLPAVVDEFTAAAQHLPIVFLPGSGTVVPVFLVGLRTGQNALDWGGRGYAGGNLTPDQREALPVSALPGDWEKTGRNAPCPCGSGKKFKHCHGTLV